MALEPVVKPKPKGKRKKLTGRKLFAYDRAFGRRWVAGADEAGRGCLAGPLVAAAVLFDYDALTPADVRTLSALNDSKQHTVEGREALYPLVLRVAANVTVTHRSNLSIDRRGLHRTNLDALSDCLREVAVPGTLCLSDGFHVPPTGFDQRPVVGGDATSAAIAAASVIAKVTRDRFMQRAAERHPGYGFDKHVGYSCPEHRDAIRRLGVTPLHRMSFQSLAYQQLELGEGLAVAPPSGGLDVPAEADGLDGAPLLDDVEGAPLLDDVEIAPLLDGAQAAPLAGGTSMAPLSGGVSVPRSPAGGDVAEAA